VIDQPSRIIVVDDDEVILKTMTEYLEQKDYNVIAVDNGLEALKMFEAVKGGFDLLITDLVMPNIGGVAIISIVKRRYPKVPIIAITGWGEHPEALAKEVEADFVLEKPFKLDEINRIIRNLLSY
jgi:DNA-binding NtrC family response regulator